MRIQYVGPFDSVEVPGIPEPVARGGVVDVDDKLAGRAPSAAVDDDGNEVVDQGEGLLAQVDNWQPAPKQRRRSGEGE